MVPGGARRTQGRRAPVGGRCAVALIGALAVGGLVGVFGLTRASGRVLVESTAPGGEHLMLVEGERDFRGFPFSVGRHAYVYVGREASAEGYGHRTSFELHPELVEPELSVESYAKRVTVTWSDAGVEVAEPSGQRLFIPRRAYAGGR